MNKAKERYCEGELLDAEIGSRNQRLSSNNRRENLIKLCVLWK